MSYDVESLFTIVPVRETINYILAEIYNHQKLKPVCSKVIFKYLLLKLTNESTFIFNTKYYKQTDSRIMGGPLSVVFSDIFMTKLEKAPFYHQGNQNCIKALLMTSLQDVKLMSLISY